MAQTSILGRIGQLVRANVNAMLDGALEDYDPYPSRNHAGNLRRAAAEMKRSRYDTNGDGKVAGEELDKAPGLKAALPRMDSNGDNAVSADEDGCRHLQVELRWERSHRSSGRLAGL